MGLADDRDLLPLGSGFDVAKRGYDRAQVDEHLERLDADLRILAADRNAALSQAGDLARQLEAARSEIESLHSQLERMSQPPTSLEGMSERLQRMLRLAQEEANEIRARAETDAAEMQAKAEKEATGLRNQYERLIAENDTRRAEMEAEHRATLDKANQEGERIRAAAQEVLQQGEADADRIRQDAENIRRQGEAEAQRLRQEGESIRQKGEHDAQEYLRQAEQTRQAADAEADARRKQVEDDFEMAMSSRRNEAMRTLAEQEAHSKAEAERRVREATEEANRRLQESTNEAHRRVREATEEANRRIGQAQRQVDTLRQTRGRLAQQLKAIRAVFVEAGPLLDLADEDQQPVEPPALPAGSQSRHDPPTQHFPRPHFHPVPAGPPVPGWAPAKQPPHQQHNGAEETVIQRHPHQRTRVWDQSASVPVNVPSAPQDAVSQVRLEQPHPPAPPAPQQATDAQVTQETPAPPPANDQVAAETATGAEATPADGAGADNEGTTVMAIPRAEDERATGEEPATPATGSSDADAAVTSDDGTRIMRLPTPEDEREPEQQPAEEQGAEASQGHGDETTVLPAPKQQ
ncbi:chromosome segregation protein [Actinoalloteichus caeruleus]|uniref:chromosome segregation protein n=1 Tax=Actinoalloteichus cyanogriseus TaxID=2893586 RepID=UPI003BB9109F